VTAPTEPPADEAGQTEPRILVDSATARYSSTIESAGMSLIVGTGHVEGGPLVMVPFVECEIAGTFGTDDEPATESILITFENATFLLESFTNEFARLIPSLASFAAGPLKPVPERIEYAIDCLQRTSGNLSVMTAALARLRPESADPKSQDLQATPDPNGG